MAKPFLAVLLLGLLWVAVQLDLHDDLGRVLIAPLAPDHVKKP
jgi:hypothetical protein